MPNRITFHNTLNTFSEIPVRSKIHSMGNPECISSDPSVGSTVVSQAPPPGRIQRSSWRDRKRYRNQIVILLVQYKEKFISISEG